jgi:hypothetical protein
VGDLKVVVFNAPPRAGKDIAAEYLCGCFGNEVKTYHKAFKEVLFDICAKTLGITVGDYLQGYYRKTPDHVWWMKDLVSLSTSAHMGAVSNNTNYSQREFLIHMSENVIKPIFGKDAFGKAFVNSLPEEGLVFVSDSGFKEELQCVLDHVGAENVLVVQIEREGCSFEGDSRKYLKKSMFESPPDMIKVINNDTESRFLYQVEKLVKSWLNYGSIK